MNPSLMITNVQFTSAPPEDADTGLLGHVSCTLNDGLRLDGLAVRRTRDGRLTLSYPGRKDGAGHQHFYVRPLDDAARLAIEEGIFLALGFAPAGP
jgi:hypothetical protein